MNNLESTPIRILWQCDSRQLDRWLDGWLFKFHQNLSFVTLSSIQISMRLGVKLARRVTNQKPGKWSI